MCAKRQGLDCPTVRRDMWGSAVGIWAGLDRKMWRDNAGGRGRGRERQILAAPLLPRIHSPSINTFALFCALNGSLKPSTSRPINRPSNQFTLWAVRRPRRITTQLHRQLPLTVGHVKRRIYQTPWAPPAVLPIRHNPNLHAAALVRRRPVPGRSRLRNSNTEPAAPQVRARCNHCRVRTHRCGSQHLCGA